MRALDLVLGLVASLLLCAVWTANLIPQIIVNATKNANAVQSGMYDLMLSRGADFHGNRIGRLFGLDPALA